MLQVNLRLPAICFTACCSFFQPTVYGQTHIPNPGNGPDIYLDWDETNDPQAPDDFIVTFADENYPDVELVKGSLTWRIWSVDTSNPNDIGDIGVISTPHAENFAVKILDDSDGPGARHVKAIRLEPTSSSNYSSITNR